MNADVTLGTQPQGTPPVLLSSHGRPVPGVLHTQSAAEFPRPRSGYAAPLTLLTALGTVALAVWLMVREGGSVWIAAAMIPIIVSTTAPFVLPWLRRRADRSSQTQGEGTVIATDHAGHVNGEDAQQRALVHVESDGTVYWLAATQPGLMLAEGDTVTVTWSRERPESCFVHG